MQDGLDVSFSTLGVHSEQAHTAPDLCGTAYRTQGLVHGRHVLYQPSDNCGS